VVNDDIIADLSREFLIKVEAIESLFLSSQSILNEAYCSYLDKNAYNS
jgi:hypothetical protein